MLRAALQPQAVVWVIEPLAARIGTRVARRCYSDQPPAPPSLPASSASSSSHPTRRLPIADSSPPNLERWESEAPAAEPPRSEEQSISIEDESKPEVPAHSRRLSLESLTFGPDENAGRGARWAAQQRSDPDGVYIKRYKDAFRAFQDEERFRLNRARLLIQDLVAWPDVREVREPDEEPPSLTDSPETLELLDEFMRHLERSATQAEKEDPYILLLALRGYTEFADSSASAELKRAALEERVLQEGPTWWVAVDDADESSSRPSSKLTGEPRNVSSYFNVSKRLAAPMILSADYLRRHPRYSSSEKVYSAWDGQNVRAPRNFHRQRLFRILSSISERMDEGGISSPNSSGLPDLPYGQVRSFISPALLHAPKDPFVLLGALQLLAATFNTAVAGRTQAAKLIAGLADLPAFPDKAGTDWDDVETIDLRALYETALVALEVIKPLLAGKEEKFYGPIRRTAKAIERREVLGTEAAEMRARVQVGERHGMQPGVLDELVRTVGGATGPDGNP